MGFWTVIGSFEIPFGLLSAIVGGKRIVVELELGVCLVEGRGER